MNGKKDSDSPQMLSQTAAGQGFTHEWRDATCAYIFDYGGTLDTGGCHWGKVLWRAYVRHSAGVAESAFRDAYVYAERELGKGGTIRPGYTFRMTLDAKLRLELEYLKANGHIGADRDALERLHDVLLDDVYGVAVDGTSKSRKVLEEISKTCPMVLVSNFYGNINTVLKEFGLAGLFKDVVESAAVGLRKPDPGIFTLGVEALGVSPRQVTVVGDSFDKDIVPARQAGCHAVWIKGEGWTDKTYDETLPDAVITDIRQLTE